VIVNPSPHLAITSPKYAKIIGTGRYLPQHCVTNQMLVDQLAASGLESSDEWIVSRTGIRQRYLCLEGETTTSMSIAAAQAAVANAGLSGEEIEIIILATSSPDMVFPASACYVQRALGNFGAPALDMQAACTGFVYAMTLANSLIVSGQYRNALVIGADMISKVVDWQDRATCVLFGDGAGAVVLQVSETPGIVTSNIHADGRQADILSAKGDIRSGVIVNDPYLRMDGQTVFKSAVNSLEESALQALRDANMTVDQIDWLIPHQANIRILQSVAKRLAIPDEKVVITVDQHANTSAASVPLALDVAVQDGRIQSGDWLLLQGVGGGFTWGSIIVQF
jgi:3-oxoacyl-[acyl-carrier-protein] synthase-3